MIHSVKAGKEFVVVSENKVGMLARVTALLADRGINILAISAQAAGGVALMNFVTDDALHTRDLLAKKGFRAQENSVLLLEVEDKPGVLMQVTKKLAAKKIDLLNIYASASASYGPCVLVLSTNNNQKALVTLKP
ncbi:MAG TPA: ACT domain-containing protein [Candidatus Omnitrophota bacterium]|nr:ACT domain-containing protein [Candidatus Omnitrophota bacterium]HPS36943.1 ACT domain-containing protein [Candidatus Omnitrophota bacterium]